MQRAPALCGVYKIFVQWNLQKCHGQSAGFGGFAAAMSKLPVWVMNAIPANHKKKNVVPANTIENSLDVIYECGLIGTYT